MNRREALAALSLLLIPQLAEAQNPQLVIEYDGTGTIIRTLSFRATRRDTVFNLTRQLIYVGTTYGDALVTALDQTNFDPRPGNPGWLYSVSGLYPLQPAKMVVVNRNTRILWHHGS